MHLAVFYIKERRFNEALQYNLEGTKTDLSSMENYFGADISYYYKRELNNAVKYFEETAKLLCKAGNKEYSGETYALVESAARNDSGYIKWGKNKL